MFGSIGVPASVMVLVVVAGLPATAASQPAVAPALTFVGAGVGLASTESENRVAQAPDDGYWLKRAELSLRVTPRIAVGFEAADYGVIEVDRSFSIGRVQVSDRQREWTATALVRLRATAEGRTLSLMRACDRPRSDR